MEAPAGDRELTTSPWLTIVTVIKDDPDGLERTLSSLRGADLTDVDHLVVDSSGDQQVVRGLVARSGMGSRLLWTEPAGVYAAMNRALAEALGEYVLFLNAGDELASVGVLPAVRDLIIEEPSDWLFGNIEIVGVEGTVVVTPPWDYSSEEATAFSRGHFPAHQATVVRTATLRSIGGFDECYRIAADYAAFLRLTELGPPRRVDLTVARFHEGGSSTTGWARSVREFHRARLAILRPTGALRRIEARNTVRQFVAMAAHRSPWPLTAALAAVTLAVLIVTGVAWPSALGLTLLVGVQGVAGAAWWRMITSTRSVSILEAVGVGLGLGTAGSMLVGLFLWWWLLPAAVAVAWFVLSRRRKVPPLAPVTRADLLALAVGLTSGLAGLVVALRAYPLSWVGEWAGYHGDMPFFEALAASVARLGPGASIFMDGAVLKYHSLAYGWAGQLTESVNAEPFVVLTRLLPLVGIIAATALAAAWTRQLTRAWWAPALAVGLIIIGGFVGATYGNVLNMDSPSQTLGAVWLLALSVAALQGLRQVSLTATLVAVGVLSIALAGGKISTAAIAAAGLVVIVAVALVRREAWRWRALAIAATAAIGMVATYLLLLAGSANSGGLGLFTLLDRASSVQGLNPVVTTRGIVAGILLLMLAVLPRWAGVGWLIGDRRTRWQPETVYGVGLALGGLATIVILSGGFNDLWFAVAASAPLSVLSAAGVAAVAAWLGPQARARVLAAGLVGLMTSVVVAAIWATGTTGIIGDGWRWAGPLAGILAAVIASGVLAHGCRAPFRVSFAGLAIVVLVSTALPARAVYSIAEPLARQPGGSVSTVLFSSQDQFVPTRDQDRQLSWTDSQAAAGAWLRDNAHPEDLIATNLTLGALVPALTRLTTYVSDIHMQAPYGLIDDVATAQAREAESWAFIDSPSADTAAPLCEAGVRWIWVDPSRTTTRDWSPFASVAWSSTDALILAFDAQSCP